MPGMNGKWSDVDHNTDSNGLNWLAKFLATKKQRIKIAETGGSFVLYSYDHVFWLVPNLVPNQNWRAVDSCVRTIKVC